jgi:hypothetical protein
MMPHGVSRRPEDQKLLKKAYMRASQNNTGYPRNNRVKGMKRLPVI